MNWNQTATVARTDLKQLLQARDFWIPMVILGSFFFCLVPLILLTMITNAKEAAVYMMSLTKRDKRYLPSVDAIMASENEHNAILASREGFLKNFIERVLIDSDKGQHESLMPAFVRVKSKGPAADPSGEKTKKAPFHSANPGNAELVLIFRSTSAVVSGAAVFNAGQHASVSTTS